MRMVQLAKRVVAAMFQPPPPKHSPASRLLFAEKWTAIALHMGVDLNDCYQRYLKLKESGWRADALNCVFKQRLVRRSTTVPWQGGRAPAKFRITEVTLRILDELTLGQSSVLARIPASEVRCLLCVRFRGVL
jgi:hypothetical protein